ncbi:hypothetical protein GBAR_LOCUS12555 [Geodia barretti]|uniref:Uncharacterized protein n=1 Tax=Geodia barretti TaxID=519541 RepID=A0AA35S1V3_GEOBA|nr:hypothetical protein GBAR_LOCUS12555 [Geodia barretti]
MKKKLIYYYAIYLLIQLVPSYLSHWSTGAYPRSWRQREWLYM